MGQHLLRRVEEFRKKQKLPILTLCKMMDVHNVTYHRWKNAGKITGAYQKIVEDFLEKHDLSTSYKPSDIAVIGIACYYPGASNPKELWENILARRVQFRRMLDKRLPLSEYYDEDPKSPEKTYLTKAAFIENFNFDWGKLRIPKKTVESTDIAHWLALDIALKTIEDAGYKLNELPLQNTGVIVGNTLTGEQTRSQTLRLRWPYVQKVLNATLGHLGKSSEERSQVAAEMEKIFKSAFYPITEDSLAGGLANTIAGRICNYLNLKGGGYIVDGACSSSLLAVATAADALKMGHMDLALAGGVDISLDPFELVGFAKAGALARDQMRVYDQKANGFLPGEGCGFVLLKRLKDAVRDKNYVYATIKGWGISSDGRGGIMEPSSSGQSFAIGRAYKDLEYKISDVDFVEGHGTGTTKGDRVELEGIATAIEKTIKKGKKDIRGCGVTSFKSIVGHTKAAAGIGGLIKAVLAVNQRILPPTATCIQPNDVFKDKARNLYPIIQGGVLPQNKQARAGISSAGFGGINCHVTVESKDKPKKELKPSIDERALFVSHQETEVFVFACRTLAHLKKIIQKFKEDLRNISIAEMADLAALLNKKVKGHLSLKAAIVTDSPEHLYEALLLLENEIDSFQLDKGTVHKIQAKDTTTHILVSDGAVKCRIGFLYPGQGSQRLNMTRTLVERYAWARDLFNLSKLPLFQTMYFATDMFLTKEEQKEFEKHLSDTKITQPAIVLSSLIWTEFLSKLGIEPQASVGHSLGELMAFYKAAAFNKETLVKFAQLRGALMSADHSKSGSMASLFCPKNKAEDIIAQVSGNIVIANINGPNQIVVSGGKFEIEKATELANKESITAYPLNVSNAFHSSFMQSASDKIQKNKMLPDSFKSKNIKVYSGMNGSVVNDRVNLNEYFSKQVLSPVDFVGTIESVAKVCDLMVEVGPGRVLTDLVKSINEKIVCLPLESAAGNDRDLNIVLAEIFVRHVPVKWEELYKNRLIKTFVPASKKKFIENQCEHPLKIDKQVLTNKFAPVLLQVQEEFDKEEEEKIKEPEIIIPGGLPEVQGKGYIVDLLINLTHKITGFDLDSITIKSKLLDDLNLDSIKAAELIGQAARTLGIAGQLDPSQLSNKTLEEIGDRLYVLSEQTKAGTAKESMSDILKRYQDKTWVRNFTSELRHEEIKTRNVNQLKELKNVLVISGKDDESLVNKIENEFKTFKAKTQNICFGDNQRKTEKSGLANCLIAILSSHHPDIDSRHPERSEGSQQFNKDYLKSIIEQLHQITDLAHSKRLDKGSFVVFVQFGGGARAIASTLFLEEPDLKVRIIDFDKSTNEENITQKIMDELQTYEDFSAVNYDNKLARRVDYYENSNPADYKKRDILWSNKDVVLVTGGAKGITAQCALEFARMTKAHMVLMGRSPMPNTLSSTNASVGDIEIIQTLKQFKNEHLKCSYYQCDVVNEKEVFNTVKEIESNLGKITGFIHGAGLNSLKRLKQATVQEAYHEALPKAMGAVNICNALKGHPPKLIIGITSIIGLTGMEGSGWYGLSNEILNLYFSVIARSKATKQSLPNIVTIAYSIWDEVGMGAKLGSVNRLAEKGIGAIPVKEGIKHFRQLVAGDPGTQQVIVTARVAGIATWKSAEVRTNQFRFIENIEYVIPGVELIARANLNIEDDPYLLDHNWKGSLLFPFVFGFEAMAQAVAYVLGIDKFDHIIAKDINLQRPIPVPQDSGTTIEIHAQVLEQEKSNPDKLVRVEIYSQDTAYKDPHFSAIFTINARGSDVIARSEATKQSHPNTIDLDMQTDIYGPILFQGKMFQCIEKIHELYYDEKTKKGECVFTSNYNKTADEFLKENKNFNKQFLIGDPFFIDSILQSMQIMIPQDLCLPRDIEDIELKFLREMVSLEFQIQSNIKRIDTDYYKCNAEVDINGLLVKITNCQLKVLDTILNNPSANDLVDSSLRDQKIIEERILKLSQQFNFSAPIIKCQYIPDLIKFDKLKRHQIEKPLMTSACKSVIKRLKENLTINNNNIDWLKSGKPIIRGEGLDEIGISISHNRNLLLCIAGKGKQGCDIELISERNKNEWRILIDNKYRKLFDQLVIILGNWNLSGTVIWSAIEILKKIYNEVADLKIEEVKEDIIIFKINGTESGYIFVSPIKLTNFKTRVISFYQEGLLIDKNKSDSIKISNKKLLMQKFGFNEDNFSIEVDYSGPQEQYVFSKQFPVTFKTNKLLSRRVYFTNFFDWMGELREYSIYPIMKDLAVMFEKGGWGLATNSVKLDILGDLRGNDVVIGRVWMEEVLGEKENIFDLCFEWRKRILTNQFERIAYCKQRTCWIKIIGHGLGVIESLPLSIKDFMDSMRPKLKEKKPLDKLIEPFKSLNMGIEKARYKNRKRILTDYVFDTTLENSNLVGNVYFANYAKWIGIVGDLYFYSLIPDFYKGTGIKGEFICLNCNIDHLAEAMPFDKILTKMYLNKIFQNGLDLDFEFFKFKEGKVINKLAVATQRVVWVKREENKISADSMPFNLYEN